MTRRQRRPCRSWCLFRFGWPERQGRLRDGGGVHAFAQYAPCLYENARIANTRKDNVYFRGKIIAMPARRPTPTLRLRRLAAELRRLRANAGLTREEVAGRTGINEATLYRLEVAKARPQARTLVALLDLYGVTDAAHRTELQALAKQSDEQSWLQSFPPDLPEPYTTYIAFEGEAQSLLNYECLFIPGLLQT